MSSHACLASKSRNVFLATLGVALSLSTGAALAGAQFPRVVVNYEDLNLAVEKDAAKLYSRLERAAHEVCRVRDGRKLSERRAMRECEKTALSNAVASIDSAMLTALHEAGARIEVARAAR